MANQWFVSFFFHWREMIQTSIMISLCANVSLKNHSNILIDEFAAVLGSKINCRAIKIVIQLALSSQQASMKIAKWTPKVLNVFKRYLKLLGRVVKIWNKTWKDFIKHIVI